MVMVTEWGELSEDGQWCQLRGKRVPISECVSGCPAPEQRPVCWLANRVEMVPLNLHETLRTIDMALDPAEAGSDRAIDGLRLLRERVSQVVQEGLPDAET